MATIPILSKLVDAQEMHRQHPDTFEVPSDHELMTIVPGNFVKVSRNNERFWLRVIGASGKYLIGSVDSMLVSNPGIDHGKIVRFEHRHIYTVMRLRHDA